MGLYRAALEMLLVRRDEAREIVTEEPPLSQADQEILLGQLAYWLVRNGRSDADRREAIERLRKYLKSMPHISSTPAKVLSHLLLRSGVLREPVSGRVDFLHKTFQEYLAARALLDEGDIESLIENAHEDHWREVVVMTVGHARKDERERIISSLVRLGDEDQEERRRLHLLAAACLEHSGALDPGLIDEVKARAGALVPPQSAWEADQLASVGDVILDVIPEPSDLTETEGLYLLRVVSRFDAEETLPVLGRMARCPQPLVRANLAANWSQVAAEDYVRSVLSNMRLDDVPLRVKGNEQVAAAADLQAASCVVFQDCHGDIDSWQEHEGLVEAVFYHSAVESFDPLVSCPALRQLTLFDSYPAEGLLPLVNMRIEEVRLLGAPDIRSPKVVDNLRLAIAMPELNRLTLDNTFQLAARGAVPTSSSATRLELISSAWMLSAASSNAAWFESFPSSVRSGIDWRRSSIVSFGSWPNIEEVLLTGWPNMDELATLVKFPRLAALKVIATDDEVRRRQSSDGIEYPYTGLVTGVWQTVMNLPRLRTLEVVVLGPEELSAVSKRETIYQVPRHDLLVPLKAKLRGVPGADVIVNGVTIRSAQVTMAN
jgi:hypothetical protein